MVLTPLCRVWPKVAHPSGRRPTRGLQSGDRVWEVRGWGPTGMPNGHLEAQHFSHMLHMILCFLLPTHCSHPFAGVADLGWAHFCRQNSDTKQPCIHSLEAQPTLHGIRPSQLHSTAKTSGFQGMPLQVAYLQHGCWWCSLKTANCLGPAAVSSLHFECE